MIIVLTVTFRSNGENFAHAIEVDSDGFKRDDLVRVCEDLINLTLVKIKNMEDEIKETPAEPTTEEVKEVAVEGLI